MTHKHRILVPLVPDCPVADRIPLEVWSDPAFASVGEAFAANFSERGEEGGALVVIAGGRVVVGAAGGWADRARSRSWHRDTLVNGFSVGKAWVAVAALRAVAAGRLRLDGRLAEVWPEFDSAQKDQVTLRQALSHQAGLPAVRHPLPEATELDWHAMCDAIAATRPWWEPGTAHGYHVNTFGFIVGEAVRRATGRTIRKAVGEVAEIAGADLSIGVDPREEHRTAEFRWDAQLTSAAPPEDPAMRLQWGAYANPPGLSGAGLINTPAWRSAEVPSANGHCSALGLAAFYATLLRGTRMLPAPLLTEAISEHSAGDDVVLGRPSRFGLGFQLTQPERPFGASDRAFGHFGAGGSLGFADPGCDVAFGYVTGSMGPRWQNPRNRALLDALAGCL